MNWKHRLDVFPQERRYKAVLLLYFFYIAELLIISYMISNLLRHEYNFAVQNAVLAVLVLTGIRQLQSGRYESAIGFTTIAMTLVLQLSFLLAEILGNFSDSGLLLTMSFMNAVVMSVMIGIFSEKTSIFVFAETSITLISLVQTYVALRMDNFSRGTVIGIVIYFMFCLILSSFVFIIQKRLAALIQEKEGHNRRITAESETKDAFLANVSHEMRNPLNAITGMTELLEQTELDARQQEYLHSIAVSNSMLISMISNLLSLNKLERGNFTPIYGYYNASECLQELSNMFLLKAAEKNISLEINTDAYIRDKYPEGLFIKTDHVLLCQAVMNLVDNAIKFTSDGRVSVTLVMVKDLERKCICEIKVKDTGCGISEKEKERIFNRFYQSSPGYRKNYSGLGIGLSVVKDIVEKLGGSIRVESEPDRGSEFTITLPFKKSKKTSAADSASTDSLKKMPARAIIADDNAVNRLYLETLFRKHGIEFASACNGLEVLELLEENRWDIVLLDMQMPEMDGFECAQRIRMHKDPQIASIKLVAITGYSFENEKKKIFDAGINELIIKPISEQLLLSAIYIN